MKNKLTINLLPIEFTNTQKESDRFQKIQAICSYFILTLILAASLVVALRIFQSQQIKLAQANLDQNSQKVTKLKPTEESLVILKNRLSAIDKLTSLPSKQRAVYNLVSQLIPNSISISSVAVDSSGNMLLSLTSSGFEQIDALINALTSPVQNENRISQVSIDSFSRSRDALYRVNLKITPK